MTVSVDDDRMLNILLVDDDEVDVITVKRAFSQHRIANRLFIARNGEEALAMLRGGDIPSKRRIVLLDLNMPKMTGLEFLKEVRKDPELRSLNVIVMTTSQEENDRVEAYGHKVSGYIVKPITFRAFADAMVMLNKYWTLMELD